MREETAVIFRVTPPPTPPSPTTGGAGISDGATAPCDGSQMMESDVSPSRLAGEGGGGWRGVGGAVISGLVWQVAVSWFMSGEEECPHFFIGATNYPPHPPSPLSPPILPPMSAWLDLLGPANT